MNRTLVTLATLAILASAHAEDAPRITNMAAPAPRTMNMQEPMPQRSDATEDDNLMMSTQVIEEKPMVDQEPSSSDDANEEELYRQFIDTLTDEDLALTDDELGQIGMTQEQWNGMSKEERLGYFDFSEGEQPEEMMQDDESSLEQEEAQ